MKRSRALLPTLRRSFLPFVIGGSLLTVLIVVPFMLLTLLRVHENRERELTMAVAASIRNHLELANRSMQFLAGEAGASDEKMDLHLARFHRFFDLFDRVSWADSRGAVIAASSGIALVPDISHILKDSEMPDPGRGTFSRPVISPVSRKLTVNMLFPVNNEGYLLGELNLHYFQTQITEAIDISDGQRQIFITDAYGNLIVHPDPVLLRTRTNLGHLPLLKEHFLDKESSGGFHRIDGRYYLTKALSLEETEWILVDAILLSSIIKDLLPPLVMVLLLFLLLSSLLVIISSRSVQATVVNPLTYLFHILERSVIEEQPRHIDIPAGSFTELETIQRAFNYLTEKITERTEKLSQFERVVQEAGYAIYITDIEGNISYVNPAFERITGFSRKEALEGSPDLLSSKMMPKIYFSSLWETILDGELWEEEIINRRKDGSLYYAYQTIAPISDEEGRVTSFVAIQADVSQQRESERRLRESETLYRNLFENAADAILLLDPDTLHISECNQTAHQSLGYMRDELKQLTFYELQIPDRWGVVQRKFDKLKSKNQVSFDSKHRSKTGEVRDVIINLTFLDLGERQQILAIVHDVTERKQVEEIIRQSERKYRLIAENSTDMISQHDPEGAYLYVSPACERLLGYRPEELVGRNSYDLFHPEDLEIIRQSHNNIMGKKISTIGSITYRIKRKEGTWIWFETLSRTVDTSGEIIAVSRDVSARVKMEKDLERAKERAEEANRAKSIFLANMSHEIRTPMNAVLGFNELLSRGVEDPKLKEYSNRIERSGRTLLSLIGDILDFSRIEAGKIQLSYSPFSPVELAEELVSMFSLEAEKQELDLQLIAEESVPPSVILDEARVRQVLINLVGNALKFTEEGSITILLRADLSEREKGECTLTFVIRDTGIGIPENEQQQIFEAFRQTEGQSTRKYGGTGLGLAISKSLAEAMGGTLSLKSRPGEGSTFTLTFPDKQFLEIERKAKRPVTVKAERAGKGRGRSREKRAGTGVVSADLYQRWQHIRASMVLDDIAAFADELESVFSESGESEMVNFSKALKDAAETLDIETLDQLLEEDPFTPEDS